MLIIHMDVFETSISNNIYESSLYLMLNSNAIF